MKLLKICGSLPLAISLLAILAAVLVPATCVETWYGSAAARFGFYGAWWFTLLCALVGANIVAALLVRLPWRKRQIGFVLAHLGVLALLVGCLLTRRHGVDAALSVFEGQAGWRAYEDSLHFELSSGSGDRVAAAVSLPFAPVRSIGTTTPSLSWFPWRLAGRDKGVLYDRDGVRLETLDYYADSRQIALPLLVLLTNPGPASPHGMMSGHGGSMPLVLTVQTSQHPHGAGRAFGLGMRQSLAGGQRVVFWMTGSDEETAAFRESAPDGPLGKKGRIVLRANGRNYQFAVDQLQPKSLQPLGKTGLEIELVKFDPTFLSVQLLVHRGKEEPRKMFLLADLPEYDEQDDRDGVFGSYWFDAAQKPGGGAPDEETLHEVGRPRIDLLQGADQKLYWRGWRAGKWSGGEMPAEDKALEVFEKTADAASLSIQRFIPSARPDTMPMPQPFAKMKAAPQRQVRVRLTVDGRAEEFWLAPSASGPLDSAAANVRRVVAGKKRHAAVALCADAIDLGVEVYLHKFRRKLDPGAAMASHYSSLIDFRDRKDPARILEKNVEVKMNQPAEFYDPATGRSYRLFQTSFQGPLSAESLGSSWTGPGDPPPRLFLSEFTLNGDPGRGLKYAACLAVICGVFIRYFLKSQSPKDVGGGRNGKGAAAGKAAAVVLAAAVIAGGGAAQAGEPAPLDWSVWRQLPVLDGGRIMPLDTFARSTVKKVCGSERPDFLPEGGAAELLFAWLVEPQRWETIAFLPAAEPGLRTDLLELPLRDEQGQPLRYISPREAAAAVKLRQRLEEISNRQRQAETAGRRPELSATDAAARELADAYSAYRQLTFQPAASVNGRDRFNEKIEGVVRDWNELEGGLMSFFSADKQGKVGKAAARAAEAVKKLTALGQKEEDAPLAEVEPAAASLERSTAELARGMSSLGDRMMKSPHAFSASQARGFRLMMQSVAARVDELARRSAAAHLALYDNGLSLRPAPALDPAALEADREPEDDAQPWIALPALLDGPADVVGPYPPALLQQVRKAFRRAAEAYADRDNFQRPQDFAAAMNSLAGALAELGQAIEPIRRELPIRDKDDELLAQTAYPPAGSTGVEVLYNRIDPFYWAWAGCLLAVVWLAASLAVFRTAAFWLGAAALAGGMAMIVVGFSLRVAITRWAPVTNMFETIVFVALCVGLLGMWFASRPLRGQPATERNLQTLFLLVTAGISLLALLIAYYVPVFPKEIRPLMPVLRSNWWLAVHVTTIVAAYGAAALAWGVGNIALGYYWLGRYPQGKPPQNCAVLVAVTYKIIQIAILLLIVGTFLGALWADVSWGRFWGWDPKEVWALISILVYMLIVHSRSAGWCGNFGMANGAVLAFMAILWAWYGVNYLMPGGKHSYGEAVAGGGLMGWLVVALFAVLVLLVSGILLVAAPMRYFSANEPGEGDKL